MSIPNELKTLSRWALSIESGGTLDKSPRTPSGGRASSTNSATWSSYENAASAPHARLGYMMGEGRFVVIDLDAPKGADADALARFEERAQKIIAAFNSYTERSNSGKGYHIFIEAKKDPETRCKETALGYEVYNHSRYLIVTGDHVAGTPPTIEPRQERLDQFMEAVFPRAVAPTPKKQKKLSNGRGTIEDILEIWQHAKNGAAALNAYHSPSCSSEDDMRLISFLSFYLPDETDLYIAFRNSPAFRETEVTRRGGEERYRKWCMSQNIKRALSNLGETYDWDRIDRARERGQCRITDSAMDQAKRRAEEAKAEKILSDYYEQR